MTHTPGPWHVENDDDFYVLMDTLAATGDDQHMYVYAAPGTRPEQREADALLIAAAPDLLAACEYLTTLFVADINSDGLWLEEAYDRASEAIAKARGDS